MRDNTPVRRAVVMMAQQAFLSCAMGATLLLATLAAAQPPRARATPRGAADLHHLVRVAASEPWTDTGVDVQPGDHVEIRSWGAITVDRLQSPRIVKPDGEAVVPTGCRFVLAAATGAPHGLIGNVSTVATLDGRGFRVGPRWAGTVPIEQASSPDGRLYLGINHPAAECDRSGYDSWKVRNDTSGAFTAEVFVWRRR